MTIIQIGDTLFCVLKHQDDKLGTVGERLICPMNSDIAWCSQSQYGEHFETLCSAQQVNQQTSVAHLPV